MPKRLWSGDQLGAAGRLARLLFPPLRTSVVMGRSRLLSERDTCEDHSYEHYFRITGTLVKRLLRLVGAAWPQPCQCRISELLQKHQVGRCLGVIEELLAPHAHLCTHRQTAGKVEGLACACGDRKVSWDFSRTNPGLKATFHHGLAAGGSVLDELPDLSAVHERRDAHEKTSVSLPFCVALVTKPNYLERDGGERLARELVAKIRVAARARVKQTSATEHPARTGGRSPGGLIALGASTGGTQALASILEVLPRDTPPTVIVQHLPPPFTTAFARRLDAVTEMTVVEGENGLPVTRGLAIVAPAGRHMTIERSRSGLRVLLSDDPPVCFSRPSVDALFLSIARARVKEVRAALLTGMGRDGAEGLLALRSAGTHTFAQVNHRASSMGCRLQRSPPVRWSKSFRSADCPHCYWGVSDRRGASRGICYATLVSLRRSIRIVAALLALVFARGISPAQTQSPAAITVSQILAGMSATTAGLTSYIVPVHIDAHVRNGLLSLPVRMDGRRYFAAPARSALRMTSVPSIAKQFSNMYASLGGPQTWQSTTTSLSMERRNSMGTASGLYEERTSSRRASITSFSTSIAPRLIL